MLLSQTNGPLQWRIAETVEHRARAAPSRRDHIFQSREQAATSRLGIEPDVC